MRDGFSQPNELYSLDDVDIESIDLDYVESRRRDRWGNVFRFASHATLNGPGNRKVQTVDVFFKTRWGNE